MISKVGKYFFYTVTALMLLYLCYMALSRLMVSFAWIRGDYPGPKILSNQEKPTKEVDWLLLHGASVDARLWQNVLNNCPQQRLLAVSLAKHNLSVKFAEPGLEPSKEIVSLLKQYKVKKGIVGHSSAALWLANAYQRCPTCFKHLQIVLIAPNLCFLNVSNLDHFLLKVLPVNSWEGPFIAACRNSRSYKQCKQDYLYGRLYTVSSTHYYKKLLALCEKPDVQHNIKQFTTNLAGQIQYVLTVHDGLINSQRLLEFIKPTKSKVMKLDNTSHFETYHYAMIAMNCKPNE